MIDHPLIIVDGSFYLHRAYHAFPILVNSAKEPVWVIYGVLSMLKKILINYKPEYMVVVFDSGGQTFRNFLFDKYKINRAKMPNDLYVQIKPLCKLIRAMGIPLIMESNIEADDIIGTLSLFATRLKRKVLIFSNDKDMAQLVSTMVTVVNTTSNIMLDPKEVELKFGVPPCSIVDYLSLVGDSSDNIPGVPNIGEKTARILLHNFGNLDGIYSHLSEISILKFRGSKSVEINLRNHRAMAFLSYKLASIKTDLVLDINSCNQLLLHEPNVVMLMSLFKRYDFKNWLQDIENNKWLVGCKNAILGFRDVLNISPLPKSSNRQQLQKTFDIDYQIIYNMQLFSQCVTQIRSVKLFAFDIVIDSLDVSAANLVGIFLSVVSGKVLYLPMSKFFIVNDDINNDFIRLDYIQVLVELKSIFEDSDIDKVGYDLKIDYSVFKRYNIYLLNRVFDIRIEFYLLYGIFQINNLAKFADDDIVQRMLVFQKNNREKKFNKFLLSGTFNQDLFYSIVKHFSLILDLHKKLWPKIIQDLNLKKIFEEIEMPLISVLSHIECIGVLVDKTILNSYSLELKDRISKLEICAHKLANESFNLSSVKELRRILYLKQKIPVLKKTPLGFPSTNEEVLKKLSSKYPISKIILKYRNLVKLKSVYADRLPTMINQKSKRIHTSYHQTMTSTGRLSSTNPNLQNIPIRNNDGRRVRQAFVVPPDYLMLSVDYSQIELRVMAHLSNDKELLSVFLSDQDVHCITASELFVTSLDRVTDDQRYRAKIINFGLIYGMTAFGLANQLSVTRMEAQHYIDVYFARYPGIKKYMKFICKQINTYGYVTTIEGRKLYISDFNLNVKKYKKNIERAAINAPVQGSAADIVKRAMLVIDSYLCKESIPAHMIIQVHDELIFEIHRDVVLDFIPRVKELMENCFLLSVPLKVKVSVGKNWSQVY
ncbi:DNA polymerase I [Blochmannia endosymbiont of Colobopsis nipponica]|uniref:DNA polymerase I n=1 Tax=Blochmannia endosymbiont of Colobopsis nipponica TaxID=2681987 RepID=UPI001782A3F1|nr:DNA polymerase I [Blochmannia endosymbiont of Colobopsis nipponica]QOI10854.1 DNA polymerase I [Blochmannia endosymbiont of Colobopsis nipponica]